MRKVDLIASVMLIAFAAVMAFIVIPRENAGGIWYGLSPYFYPMLMLAGMAIASVGLLVQALARPDLYKDYPSELSFGQLGFFLLSMVIIVACVIVVDYFGFWVGGPLLIAAIMLFMGERNPLRIIPVAVLTVAAAWALVRYGLQTPLP